jgi:hypothetical protein
MIRLRIVLIAAAVMMTAGASASALASAATGGGQHPSILVSPIRAVIRAQAGVTRYSLIHVEDFGTTPETVSGTIAGFRELADGDMAPAPADPVRAWLTVTPQRFTLRPKQVETVTVAVRPRFADAGDHYLAVSFVVDSRPVHGSTVVVRVTVAANSDLIVIAPGKVHHATAIHLSGPSWSFGGPVNLGLTIANYGNTYYLSNDLKVTDSHGTATQFDGALVLAGATRVLNAQWTDVPAFCLCRLHLTGTNQTVTVIRIPTLPLIGLVLLAMALAFGLILWRRATRPTGATHGAPRLPRMTGRHVT